MSYSEQRYNRLVDAIDDYLHDDDVTADQFYSDLIKALTEGMDYHTRYERKFASVRVKVEGLAKPIKRAGTVPLPQVSTDPPSRF